MAGGVGARAGRGWGHLAAVRSLAAAGRGYARVRPGAGRRRGCGVTLPRTASPWHVGREALATCRRRSRRGGHGSEGVWAHWAGPRGEPRPAPVSAWAQPARTGPGWARPGRSEGGEGAANLERGVVVDDAQPVQLGGRIQLRGARVRAGATGAPHQHRRLHRVHPLRAVAEWPRPTRVSALSVP